MGFTLGFRLFLLQSNIFSVKSVNTINHSLNQLNFRVSQTMLIGNVIGTACLTTRFTTGTTGLYIQFLASGLQFVNTFLGPSGQVNVDRSSHTSTQVGGAGVQVSQSFIEHEFSARFSHDGIPNSLDTGMRASVHVDLPGWTKEGVDKLKARAEELNVQPRGTRGESGGQTGHTYDISNKHRLGYSEVQLVQTMIDGVNTLYAEDVALQKKQAQQQRGHLHKSI